MPYDEDLDARIVQSVSKWHAERKKMFGGTCYLLRGNLFCGVYQDRLILRLGDEAAAEALEKPFVSVFDITGRAMKGWVMVEKGGFEGRRLAAWLDKAKVFAQTLPPK
jgi:hypothetical protein